MTTKKRIVILGGVAGDASAAMHLRRDDAQAEIVLVERGANVPFANRGRRSHVRDELPRRSA
jgi:NADH dehydrogenase FAD-containing subunit